MVVSSFSFQESSTACFAAVDWKVITDGNFQVVGNVKASSLDTLRTRKSLNKCQLGGPVSFAEMLAEIN